MYIFKGAFDVLLCNLLLDEQNSNNHTLHLHSASYLRLSQAYQKLVFVSLVLQVPHSMLYLENQLEA